MWRKQCHVYHPWLGVATIPPMAYIFMMTGGWLWHSFTHTISVCSENHPFTSSHRRAISFRHAMTGSIHRFFKSEERHAYWNWLCEHWNWSNLRYKLVGGWPTPLKNITPYCTLLVGQWGCQATPPPALKNMSSSVGMMTFPIYGKIKNGPNHQQQKSPGRLMYRWVFLKDFLHKHISVHLGQQRRNLGCQTPIFCMYS